MKRIRFLTGVGDGRAVISRGQLLTVSMVPGDGPVGGSYVQINNSSPIFVPAGSTLSLEAADLGNCCGADICDMYPGEQQIEIVFGRLIQPPTPPAGDPPAVLGDAPKSWLVVYNGC